MKVKDYEYHIDDENEILEERKKELLKSLKDYVKDNHIALYRILEVGENDAEYTFLYGWLEENDIDITGINFTMAGEHPNYNHTKRVYERGEKSKIEKKYFSVLERDVQEDLFRKLKELKEAGDFSSKYYEIRDKLILHNMKLARYVANSKGLRIYNMSQEDREGYATLGLISAVEHFDVDRGFQFSTYACKSIYFSIGREIMKTDRQQFLMQQYSVEMEDVEIEFFNKVGREATDEEIFDILGYPKKKIMQIRAWRNSQKEPEQKRTEIPNNEEIFEFEDRYYTAEGEEISKKEEIDIRDEEENPEKDALAELLKEEISKVLKTLTPREEAVLRERFGLDDGIPKTLEKVGKGMQVGGERIRQIEARALRKLRHPSRAKRLLGMYLENDFSR